MVPGFLAECEQADLEMCLLVSPLFKQGRICYVGPTVCITVLNQEYA